MKVVEQFNVPEPQWILDRTGSGPLYWRRDSTENNSRVKFRYDVEVKEFHRGAHELEDAEWTSYIENPNTVSMTCLMCIALTVLLPWYIFIGFN